MDRAAAWRGDYPPPDRPAPSAVRNALARARRAEAGAYEDVHCWVFTPAGFAAAMGDLAALDLLGFACTEIHPTVQGEIDFSVHLMKSDDAAQIADSWRWAVWKAALSPRRMAPET